MASTEEEIRAKIASIKKNVVELQQKVVDGGLPAAAEARIDADLEDLKQTVDPTVQNPPGTPPDPGLPV